MARAICPRSDPKTAELFLASFSLDRSPGTAGCPNSFNLGPLRHDCVHAVGVLDIGLQDRRCRPLACHAWFADLTPQEHAMDVQFLMF